MRLTTTRHVDNFLLSVDARGSFLKIAEMIVEDAGREPVVRETLKKIGSWLGKQENEVCFQKPTVKEFNACRTEERMILAVIYLYAMEALRVAAAARPMALDEIAKELHSPDLSFESIEPEFARELVVEAERRAYRDPAFARKLKGATEDLQWLGAQLTYLSRPLVPLFEAQEENQEPKKTDTASMLERSNTDRFIGAVITVATVVYIYKAFKQKLS
jgi:hypothetical protein